MKKFSPQESMEVLKNDEDSGKYIVTIPITPTPEIEPCVWIIKDNFGLRVGYEDDKGRAERLIKTGYKLTPLYTHPAPTPEDEPIGYISSRAAAELRDGHHDGYTMHPRKGIIYSVPLYLRPAPPSELVKTAEECLKYWDSESDGSGNPQRYGMKYVMEELRAALDKVKP